MNEISSLEPAWSDYWPQALELWSPYAKLRDPEWNPGKMGSFAQIRLTDHQVMVNLHEVADLGLKEYGLEILAHEVGHHIYAPGDLSDMARLLFRLKHSLPTQERAAPLVANLYTDLLINDRLWRNHSLPMHEIYKILEVSKNKKLKKGNSDPLWTFYLRTYEILWGLDKGWLTGEAEVSSTMEGDALLANRIVRRYSEDWLKGAGRYGWLCLEYLIQGGGEVATAQGLMDLQNVGSGEGLPGGILAIDPEELEGSLHPSLDPELTGVLGDEERPFSQKSGGSPPKSVGHSSKTNYREPYELGEVLAQMGLVLPVEALAHQYYKERAQPYLVPFPRKKLPQSLDPLPEGLEIWDLGSPLERIHWVESAARSPIIIPGLTTLEQMYGESPGNEPNWEPVDLDIYVDSSGSMPDPRSKISYPALAGAIISLSALRAGARVQAVLWSGKHQVLSTQGFVKNEARIFGVLTGYFGGGTAFPLPTLRETYRGRTPKDRKVHILHISDDGITTLFDKDEKDNSGWDIAAMALEKGGGGGTMVLEMQKSALRTDVYQQAQKQGWDIYTVNSLEGLVDFARSFASRHYQDPRSKEGIL